MSKRSRLLSFNLLVVFLSIYLSACSNVEFATEEGSLNKANLNIFEISIQINGGAPYTNSKNVQIDIEYGNATEVLIANDPECKNGMWRPITSQLPWTLDSENKSVPVYAKFKRIYRDNIDESDCYSDDIIHDNIAPKLAFVPSPSFWKNEDKSSIEFHVVEEGSGIQETLCRDSSTSEFKPCSNPFIQSHPSEGLHNLDVQVTDLAGNKSDVIRHNWGIDRTVPKIVANSVPPALSNLANSEVLFTVFDGHSGVQSIECSLDGQPWSSCYSKFQVASPLSEGMHSLKIRSKDFAGNVSELSPIGWQIDLTAPTIEIIKHPPAYSNIEFDSFEFRGSKTGETIKRYLCRLDSQDEFDCASPYTLSHLENGQHSFSIKGYDMAGNLSQTTSYLWTVDHDAPTVKFLNHPSLITNTSVARFEILAEDIGSAIFEIQCSLDAKEYKPCNKLEYYTDLSEGEHSLRVQVIDLAGNTSQPISHTWFVDTHSPIVEITKAPPLKSGQKNGRIEFVATDIDGSGIESTECSLDAKAKFSICTSPFEFSSLEAGSYSFYVRSYDKAGNVSSLAEHHWSVDVTPPQIQFDLVPTEPLIEGDSGTLKFTVTDMGGGIQSISCLYNNVAQSCQSGEVLIFEDMKQGLHQFEVTATDTLGNFSTAKANWFIDPKPVVCVEGKRLGIWLDPDQSGLLRDELYLGAIVTYSGNSKIADNYNYYSASAHPIVGPVPKGYEMNVFFYEGPDGLGFNLYANLDEGGSSDNKLNIDVSTSGNALSDQVLISDDGGELKQEGKTATQTIYRGRFHYWNNTDGGAIGPFNGDDYKIQVKVLESGDIKNARFFSADGVSFTLMDQGKASSFVIAFKGYKVCQ
ncbi:MAG: hypothetical protein KDD61_15985 [Bdellovibrionales bacterium]|nr:hypothetical protein [Bdellovibrionales bacterium]